MGLGTLGLVFALAAPFRADAVPQGYETVIREAVQEFDASHWEEARALFKRAHAQRPSARTWRGLGITAFELRQYVEAIRELASALDDPRKPLTEAQRRDVEGLLARARGFVGVLRLHVQPATARVLLDGEPFPTESGEAPLNPGAHTLDVQAEGYVARASQINVEAGAQEELEISLVPSDAHLPARTETPPPSVPEPPHAASAQGTTKRKRPVAWSLLGATAVAAPVGLSLYIVAAGKSRTVNNSSCLETDRECTGSVDAQSRRGERLAVASYALFGISGALALSSAAAFLFEGRGMRTSLSMGPRALLLTHRF
jgi:hypothetical protein